MNACTPADGPAIDVLHLRKSYGETAAVDDVSFSVAEGEIFGILGPNGAGKTSAIECVMGLRSPDSGSVRVMGLDPGQDSEQLHLIVGAQLQASALPGLLKVGEILRLYRSFYPQPADVAELVHVLGLAGRLKKYYISLSGGQKQRLSIALALIGRPKIAMLDEMTTGLDPQARRDTWDLPRALDRAAPGRSGKCGATGRWPARNEHRPGGNYAQVATCATWPMTLRLCGHRAARYLPGPATCRPRSTSDATGLNRVKPASLPRSGMIQK